MQTTSELTTERTLAREKLQAICQKIADVHYAVACAEDQRISRYDMPTYKNTRRALIASIRVAYNLTVLKAERVYDVWVDCSEPLTYCVRYVRENSESHVYSR